MVNLSVIILSYNTKEMLRKCLIALQAEIAKDTKTKYEVIVVDNASTDGSLPMIEEEFPTVIRIQNKSNVGFAKGNNPGVRVAKGEYVLFLNSDAILEKQTEEYPLRFLLSFMDDHPQAGALTCRVNLSNGEIDDACHRGFPTPWNSLCHFSGLGKLFPYSKLINGYHLGYQHLNQVHEIDALAGAFMLVRRKAGDQIGWWDEDYFFYGEDLDFCYELKQKGWKIFFVPDVTVVHYKGVSSGIKDVSQTITKATVQEKIAITNARFEAMKIFYEKHYIAHYPKIVTYLVMKAIDFKLQSTLQKYNV